MKKSRKRKEGLHLPSTIHAAEASASAKQTEKELEAATPSNIEDKFKELIEGVSHENSVKYDRS